MQNEQELVRTYFEKLGLTPEIAAIYTALRRHGPQAISELARTSGIERTRLYRLTSELENSNLIEVQLLYKRRIFHAAPISNIQILISKKEQELEQLQAELVTIDNVLSQPALTSPTTRVQFYQGIDGAKQMFWNQTKTHTNVVAILHEAMQHQTKRAFFARWVETMNQRGVNYRLIVDDHFIHDINKWYDQNQTDRTKLRQTRHIAPNTFTISHATVIYDDVVLNYDGHDKDMFGIEIHNSSIAQSQRQFFEILWQQATPIDDVPRA